jgi:hypothetical protein
MYMTSAEELTQRSTCTIDISFYFMHLVKLASRAYIISTASVITSSTNYECKPILICDNV